MTYNIEAIRSDFPILERKVHGVPLIYLDNGASAQKPQCVIDTVRRIYSHEYANVHRGLHYLSNLATDHFEAVRGKIQHFIGANDEQEIILTSGTTEAFNLISYGYALPRMQAGDEIILSIMEHHANIVPWHFLRERLGVILKWVEIDGNGDLDPQAVIEAITPRTKLITITQMSNVLGTIVDVKSICAAARERNIAVAVDGSQSAVHMPIDVVDIGCDFFTLTGHKLYGPTGSGALYIRSDIMQQMRPFMGGGAMIGEVKRDRISYNTGPHKFEAGTPPIVQIIGLGAAIDYISNIGIAQIAAYEQELCVYAQQSLENLQWLNLQGHPTIKGGIFSFTFDNAGHAHDISTVLDQKGIAVRAGHHCAQPLMEYFGLTASCRASLGMYNTKVEIDHLVAGLKLCYDLFS